MALFPSAYDFAAAQVPSPLTEDMERDRREKMAEKKKAQKKAKRQREKVNTSCPCRQCSCLVEMTFWLPLPG